MLYKQTTSLGGPEAVVGPSLKKPSQISGLAFDTQATAAVALLGLSKMNTVHAGGSW